MSRMIRFHQFGAADGLNHARFSCMPQGSGGCPYRQPAEGSGQPTSVSKPASLSSIWTAERARSTQGLSVHPIQTLVRGSQSATHH